MKNKNTNLLLFLFFAIQISFAQNILISQGGTVNVNGTEMFYDAGGPSGNVTTGEFEITLCPTNPNEKVVLDFNYFETSFSTGPNVDLSNTADYLEIFNGSNNASDNIGTLQGNYSSASNYSILSQYTNGSNVRSGVKANSGNSAVLTPTIFTSTDASGCLTLSFKTDKNNTSFRGWEASVKTYSNLESGCNVDFTSDETTICNGDSANISIDANLVDTPLLVNFNDNTTGSFNVTAGQITTGTCGNGPDNTEFLWMSNAGTPRELKTNGLDLSNGGVISFDYKQATADGSPCEAPDQNGGSGVTEGVYLQYSTDGSNWTTFKYIFPYGQKRNNSDHTITQYGCGTYTNDWTKMTYPIPVGAETNNTFIRWIQSSATSASTDNWGLDNISISTVSQTPATTTLINVDTGVTLATSTDGTITETLNPTTTTNYKAVIDNGTTSCEQNLTITVNTGTASQISYTGSPFETTDGPVNVTITGAPITGATYTVSPSTGLTINPTTGEITPSTSTAGTMKFQFLLHVELLQQK